ncbi:MAG TPA: hypothetical protein VFM54_09525 [Micromonosporaceae bacterium]|nr:hypothetical protein [Micromonosporaceae bacterium]
MPGDVESPARRGGGRQREAVRPDADREVDLEEAAVLPETTRDDTDAGWGERHDSNDDRLRAERPPHWE